MPNKQMLRVTRLAHSLEDGAAIVAFITRHDCVDALLDAAERGLPPVAALSRRLCEHFGPDTFKPMITRQLVGLTVRVELEKRGYVVDRRGARISRDALFRSGATYVKEMTPPEAAPLLARFIDTLSEDELRWVTRHVGERLKALGLRSERAE